MAADRDVERDAHPSDRTMIEHTFSIALGGDATGSAACPAGSLGGRIQIGRFVEGFCASMSYWAVAEYRAQWTRALEHVVRSDGNRSALVTDALDPDAANFLTWWPMYRSGGSVRFANALVPHNLYDLASVLEDPASSVPTPDELWNDSGVERPSEWLVDVSAVIVFLAQSR